MLVLMKSDINIKHFKSKSTFIKRCINTRCNTFGLYVQFVTNTCPYLLTYINEFVLIDEVRGVVGPRVSIDFNV